MVLESNAYVVKTARLSEEQARQVEALVAACRQEDRLDTDLYLESDITEGRINQILSYVGDELVGVASLSTDEGIEVQILVHPAHRRKGIGRALLEGAREEGKRRGSPHLLLVGDGDSAPGNAFAQAVGARHAYTEYRMQFDPAAPQAPSRRVADPEDHIRLQQVAAESIEVLASIAAAGEEAPSDSIRQRILAWLEEPNQRLYVGTRADSTPVGMLRVATYEENVYINTFSVLPELRGRGYGRQMLMEIVRLLSAEGRPVLLEVEAENRNALSLYLSCGFKQISAYRYYALPL